MRSTAVLRACLAAGIASLAMIPVAQAQTVSPITCDALDQQGRHTDNGFHPSQEAKVKVHRAHFHSGPASVCRNGRVFVVRDDYLTAHYHVDGWIYATYIVRNGEDHSAWFQESDIELIGAYGDANARAE